MLSKITLKFSLFFLTFVIVYIYIYMCVFFVLNKALRHEDVRGSEGIDPSILNLDTKWR
jgi:hypothetical protein